LVSGLDATGFTEGRCRTEGIRVRVGVRVRVGLKVGDGSIPRFSGLRLCGARDQRRDGDGLLRILARSAPTLDVSRPDVHSRHGLSACRIAKATRSSRRLGFVSAPRRFDSFRLGRPGCQVGFVWSPRKLVSGTARRGGCSGVGAWNQEFL
jgi:hypothetical protein